MGLYEWAKEALANRLSDQQITTFRNFYYKLRRIYNLDGAKTLRHMNEIIVERPIKIAVETYSLCNSLCVFCGRRKLRASRKLMSLELFERICSEYASMGGGFLGFSPLLADPLLDPLLLDRIRLLRKCFSNIYPHIFTNAIALTKLSDDQLIEVLTACDHIDISIGGLNRVDYRTMFGVDRFDQVSDSLNRLAKINENLACPCKLALHIRTHRRREVVNSPVLRKFMDLGYKCSDIVDNFSDWGGLVTEKDLPEGARLKRTDNSKRNVPCIVPMIGMMIMPDGLVLGCGCMDAKEETSMGYLHESSLRSIWKGNAYSNLRSSFAKGKLYPVCMTCTFYSNSEYLLSHPGLKNFDPSKNFWGIVSA